MAAATGSVNGYLTSTDWTTFNSKQATITFGTGVQTALGVNVGTAGSVVVNGGALGTPSSGTLTSATGLPVATGISGLGTGIATALAVNTGSAGAPVLFNGAGGTPSSLTLTNATGLPIAGITQNTARLLGRTTAAAGATEEITVGAGLTLSAGSLTATGGSGTVTSVGWTGGIVSVATATTTPAFTIAGTSGGIPYFSSASTWATSAALAANALVIGGGAGVAPATTTTGTGVVTALGVAVGSAGAFVTNGGALGTPSSGTVTNLTGTASININGTVGATTPTTGSFTTITGSGLVNISGASAGQIQFPATQNASAGANVLDDYEEGTCTLTWLLGGVSTGFTFTLQVGWYTKIGNLVTVGWNMLTSARGSGTGALTWSGLPFSTANAMGGMLGYTEKFVSITCPQFYINIGTPTTMNLLADAVGNSITNTNLDAATNYVRGSFSYNT